ncbi:MAG: hypothetical protein EBZ36_03980 [Acidobacteria bacterium]|nr:hypothetical protein [Acidobacteriota bacterium]
MAGVEKRQSYIFGSFVLETSSASLRRGDKHIPLTPKRYEILLFLVKNAGQLLLKEEIIEQVWPGQFIEEGNLTNSIYAIRRLIEDNPRHPQMIQTVSGRGYRFQADVQVVDGSIPETVKGTDSFGRNDGPPGFNESAGKYRERAGADSIQWLFRHPGGRLALIVLLLLLGSVAAGWTFRRAFYTQSEGVVSFPRPLTSFPGAERFPALSRDGRLIAFTWAGEQQDNDDIYVKQTNESEAIRITTHPGMDRRPAWSPDGRYIAFLRAAKPIGDPNHLLIVPALGGIEREIARVDDGVDWSPDGQFLAVTGLSGPEGGAGIHLIGVNGAQRRRITQQPLTGGIYDSTPRFSPDGRSLAFLRYHSDIGGEVFIADLTSGAIRQITNEQKLAVRDLGKTYVTFDRLRREGRDSVWAYVARNLSRPLAFSAAGGWANVLTGNPPWVAFRHMSADLQKRFKALSKGERVFVGGKLATQNDLCALFVVRATHLYLRSGGRLAFVLPMAALTRGQFERFRSGSFNSTRIAWDEAWTMDESVSPLFPVPSCAAFGRKRALSQAFPKTVRAYSGSLPYRDAPEAIADKRLTVVDRAPALSVAKFEGGSEYRKQFRQGASLVPRMLCFVDRGPVGRLGTDPTAPLVRSRRTSLEKKPWAQLAGVEGRVEADFLRPIYLGESILPFRVYRGFEGVIPVDAGGRILDAKAATSRGIDGLGGWLRKAESIWYENSDDPGMSLTRWWNYHNKLTSQFPISPVRVVYAKAGTLPAASLLRDERGVIDHMLYWMVPASEAEGRYLVAILNSETARDRASKYQARGQFGARHFDKVIFNLPIPRFDETRDLHTALAKASEAAEEIAAGVSFPEGTKFQRARSLVREELQSADVFKSLEALVAQILDGK